MGATPGRELRACAERLRRSPTRQTAVGASREFPLNGLADNSEFQSALRTGEIETMHTQETTLEDVFVQVTGRPAVAGTRYDEHQMRILDSE